MGTDKKHPPRITLVSTVPINLAEANNYLKQSGFSNLVKINNIVEMAEIPLLGTGKTDYKSLAEV